MEELGPDTASRAQTRLDLRFRRLAQSYRMSLEGYREFFDFLHGTLDELDAQRKKEWSGRFSRALEPLTRDEARALMLFTLDMPMFKDVMAEWIEDPDTPEARTAIAKEYVAASEDERPKELTGPAAHAFSQIVEPLSLESWRGLRAQRERLYRSVLTGVVAQFEVLVAGIAHQYYNSAPGAVGGHEKVLSLKDLRDIGSIEGAIDLIIERRVDSLLAGSMDDWADFFEKQLKIDLRALSLDWDRLVEYVQRRHLIVHSGGTISRRYLSNVHPKVVSEYFGANCSPGSHAHLSEDYVQSAIREFEVAGMLLALTAWVSLAKNHGGRAETYLTGYVYDNLVYSRWDVARAIAQHGIDSRLLSQSGRIVCRFNYWLCVKESGEFEQCRDEVEAFDVSALHTRFSLVRLALLEDLDGFCEVVENANGADLDRQAWDEWPVFRPFRSTERFQEQRRKYLRVGASVSEVEGDSNPDEDSSPPQPIDPDPPS